MVKNILKMIIILFSISIVGCSNEIEKNNENYSYCNRTSSGKMAETEDGFFIIRNSILYYADKDDMETWVAVCNKPDCMHTTSECNAYVPRDNIIQENENFYGVVWGNHYQGIFIFELKSDGSGLRKVYELPEDDNIMVTSFGQAEFLEQIVLYYGYLDEVGNFQKHIMALREDKNEALLKQELYTETVESKESGVFFTSGNGLWAIRGDDVIVTEIQQEEGEPFINTLWRPRETELEKIRFSEDIDLIGGYLSDETFTYYEMNEGFYNVDIYSGEKELIVQNQINDARGYVLSEEYMVETNRYQEYKPEDPYLKFYKDEKILNIKLPEEIAKSDGAFYPISLASDRIFFNHSIKKIALLEDGTTENVTVEELYYFMIDEEEPELIYIGEIPQNDREYIVEDTNQEETESTDMSEMDDFEDVVVIDSEQCLLKVIDTYVSGSNYCVDIYFENLSDKAYDVKSSFCSINGIQCNPAWGESVNAKEKSMLTLRFEKKVLEEYQISEMYEMDAYTNVEIGFIIREAQTLETVEEKFITIYPQGEENATTFTRETQNTDMILIDNENVSVIITGYEKNFVEGDTINVVLVNKTDKYVRFFVEDASVNGIDFDGTELYDIVVNPRKCSIYPMTLFDYHVDPHSPEATSSFFVKNNITNIKEIKLNFNIYPCDYARGEIGDSFINKTFVLTP